MSLWTNWGSKGGTILRKFFIAAMTFVVSLLLVSDIYALTIHFDTANYGPSEVLNIGGVTISDSLVLGNVGGEVAAVSGAGLGSTYIGPNYSVDRQETYYSVTATGGHISEGLHLAVDGKINSITIDPYFSVLGPGEPAQLPFEIGYILTGVPSARNYMTLDPTDQNTVTITFDRDWDYLPTGIDIANTSDFGEFHFFWDYLQEHTLPVTFQYGFSILSLTYTPYASVPEPSPMIVLAAGLVGLAAWRRKKPNKNSAHLILSS